MFQIFDCNGQPVGRPEGYEKHRIAQALAERRGRIKTAIWTAYHSQEGRGELGRRIVYRIEWQDLVDSKILASETAITKFDFGHGGITLCH